MEDIDPSQRLHLDVLEEEYRRRHGVAVEWLKAAVGEGDNFSNEIARVILSENGAWFECIDLPMEFSGAAGAAVGHRFLSDRETITLMNELAEVIPGVTAENTRAFGLLILYTRSGIMDARESFVYQHRAAPDGSVRTPWQIGAFRPDQLPLLIRCRIDTDLPIPMLSHLRGVAICLGRVGESNLLVQIPYEGEQIFDLGSSPFGQMPN